MVIYPKKNKKFSHAKHEFFGFLRVSFDKKYEYVKLVR